MRVRSLVVMSLAAIVLTPSAAAQPGADEVPPGGPAPLAEAETERTPLVRSAAYYWQNDGIIWKWHGDDDGHYTNGVKIEIGLSRPWPDGLMEHLPGSESFENGRQAGGLVFSQLMFTPDNIRADVLIVGDRPYAGHAYAGLIAQRSTEEVLDHFELDVGIVGEWSGAEGVQKAVHAAFWDQPRPNGWRHQLHNEPTLNFSFERRWKAQRGQFWGLDVEAIPSAGFRAGNVHIDAAAGAMARIGVNVPDDFGPASLRGFRDHTAPISEDDWSVYGYGRVSANAIARNMFLDGNTFRNSHSVDKEPLVGELQIGLAARHGALEFGWSLTWATDQFVGQSGGDSQGQYFVAYRFDF